MEILLSSEMKNRKEIIDCILNILDTEFKRSVTDLDEPLNLYGLDRAYFINHIEEQSDIIIPINDDHIFSDSINSIVNYLVQLDTKMTKWKTKIELPDDSYLPDNIDLNDTYFSKNREAQKHLDNQIDALIDWMENDESCNKPLSFSFKRENEPDGGSITYLILGDYDIQTHKMLNPVFCKFKIIKEIQ